MSAADNPLLPPRRIWRWTRPKLVGLIFALAVLLIAMTVGGVLGTVYLPQRFNFVPAGVYDSLNRLLLPTTLPKTTYQIVLASLESARQIRQFNQGLFISFDVSPDRMGLRLDGPVSLSPPAFDQKSSFSLDTNFYGEQVMLADIRSDTQTLAVRLRFLPPEVVAVLGEDSPVGNLLAQPRWYTLTWQELGVDTGRLASWQPKQLARLMPDRESIDAIENLGVERLGGQLVHHLRVTPTVTEFIGWVRQVLLESGLSPADTGYLMNWVRNYLHTVEVDVWVNAQTYAPARLTINLGGVLPQLPSRVSIGQYDLELPDWSGQPFELRFGWELTAVNQPQRMTPVPTGTPVRELVEKLTALDGASL